MSRYIKEPTAYDPRSGFKVKLDDMVEDGEVPGLFVHKDEADELNMQRFPAKFTPENTARKRFPPSERETITLRVGELFYGENDDAFQLIETRAPVTGAGQVRTFITASDTVTYLGSKVVYLGQSVVYTDRVV